MNIVEAQTKARRLRDMPTWYEINEGADAIEVLIAENKQLRADAARYRWVVNAVSADEWFHCFGVEVEHDDHLNNLIDAALERTK